MLRSDFPPPIGTREASLAYLYIFIRVCQDRVPIYIDIFFIVFSMKW